MSVPAASDPPRRPRVIWLILDGFGCRHWELVRRAPFPAFPAMKRIDAEGLVVPIGPSAPLCGTPTALATLLTGESPYRHGVWGYRMPVFGKHPYRFMSGFDSVLRAGWPVWEDLEERGLSYSLMNVAFRNDRIWRDPGRGLAVAFDGYKTLRGAVEYRLRGRRQRIRFRGIDLRILRRGGGMEIRKGGRRIAEAPMGRLTGIRLTHGTTAIAFPLDARTLFLYGRNEGIVRGWDAESLEARDFLDVSVFRTLRSRTARKPGSAVSDAPVGAVPEEYEMTPAAASFAVHRRIALEILDRRRTDLAVLYFPLIDNVNHAYMDTVDADWPEGRGSEILRRSFALVDGLISDLASRCGAQDLLVISSDHGAVPYRRTFFVNELFAEAGLLPREGGRLCFSAAIAYLHPSECGLVLSNARAARARGMERSGILSAVRGILKHAEASCGVRMGLIEAPQEAPWLCILYPLDDAKLSSAPCGPGRSPIRSGRAGGHHQSPFCPSPWIPSVLGIWGPDRSRLPPAADLPPSNEGLKALILELLCGLTTSAPAVESTERP